MKFVILVTTLMNLAFAQTDFFTKNEAAKTLDYLDMICADTYCGGDINFHPHKLTCKADTCLVEFSAAGYSLFNTERSAAAVGATKVSRDMSDVFITFNEIEIGSIDEDGFQAAGFSFTCTLTNLWANMATYDSKKELIYEMVVFGCVRELEGTVFMSDIY
jgi:hypothetical protein